MSGKLENLFLFFETFDGTIIKSSCCACTNILL